jgi:SAM-dependent methyltransferase
VSDWGSGYVTDIPYVPGYYVQQSPVHMVVAARLAGVACDLPDDDDPIHYLELGCGVGLGALALAASNASWRVTGVDFNPAHIATARAFARDAGIRNATFLEADLATLAEDREADGIPEADFVSAHGVWSWVPASVRAGIVRLLRAKVRAGGVVHLSYNVLPGWQSALGMQRLIRAGGLARSGRSDRQAQAGFELLRVLHGAGAYHLAGGPFVEKLVKGTPDMAPAYLAHEFMNASWSPCFHGDVVAALSEAKLEWIGPASLLEDFPDLLLSPAERKVFDGVEDPLTRELIKDLCLARAFRHDIFMRGPNRLAGPDLYESLREIPLTLAVNATDFSFEIEMAKGAAQLSREFYAPVVAALAEQPQKVGSLISLRPSADKVARNPAEVIGILIGTGQALPVLRPGAPLSAEARALNELIVAAFGRLEHRGATLGLASTALGAGLPMSSIELFVHHRLGLGEDQSALNSWVDDLGARLEPEARERLHALLSRALSRRVIFPAVGLA